MDSVNYKNEDGKDIHNGIFKSIPHFIKNHLRANCLQDGFVMYNDEVLIHRLEVIPRIHGSMVLVDFCQNNESVVNFTTDDMTSKFEAFSNNNIDALYITSFMCT